MPVRSASRRGSRRLAAVIGALLLTAGAILFLNAASPGSPDRSATGAEARDTIPLSVPAEGAAFVASSRGGVYYPVACDAWSGLAPANLVWFSDEADALAAGYRRSRSSRCRWVDDVGGAGSDDPAMDDTRSGRVEETCTVARIVDGDTLVCEEGGERIRLLLVDAPELSQGEPGRIASEALARMLPPGSLARVERDVRERDRYRRLLAYLYDEEGRMVNEELARLGVVTVSVYPPNVRHVDRIRAAVEEARAGRRGLWSGSAFECAPADHRAGRCP